ncbi:hypothetical protein Ancab_028136 [Ancistrocladus abbreviatus]
MVENKCRKLCLSGFPSNVKVGELVPPCRQMEQSEECPPLGAPLAKGKGAGEDGWITLHHKGRQNQIEANYVVRTSYRFEVLRDVGMREELRSNVQHYRVSLFTPLATRVKANKFHRVVEAYALGERENLDPLSPQLVDVAYLGGDGQVMHCKVRGKDGRFSSLVSVVYGYNLAAYRLWLWEQLQAYGLGGDYERTLRSMQGHRAPKVLSLVQSKAEELQKLMIQCDMILRQRVKLEWVLKSYSNTAYFHVAIKA